MKHLVFMFFFGLSFTAFSANKAPNVSLPILDIADATEKMENLLKIEKTVESSVAFECYYTVEWLYIDSPFIAKLDAFA